MGLLSACGDDSDAVAEYDRRVEVVDGQMRSLLENVLGRTGGRTDDPGVGAHQVCGMGPPFSGPQYRAVVVVRDMYADAQGKIDAFRSALEEADWVVETPTPTVIEAERGPLRVRVENGAGGTQVTMHSGCVDTSSGTAEDIADRRAVDLDFGIDVEPPGL